MHVQKEKLENELRFLKDTLDAGLISKEEYEKEKQRLESKISDIAASIDNSSEKVDKSVSSVSGVFEQAKEEKQKQEEPIQPIQPIHIQETKHEEPKLHSHPVHDEHEHIISQEHHEHHEQSSEVLIQIKSKEEKPIQVETYTQTSSEEPAQQKSSWKRYAYLAVFIIAVILIFSYLNAKDSGTQADVKKTEPQQFISNPIPENAPKENIADKDANLIIITDDKCAVCDTERMQSILTSLFPELTPKLVSLKEKDAKQMIKELEITVLPAYIITADIEKSPGFEGFKAALIKKSGKFVVTPAASGSSYFINREENQREFALYVIKDDPSNSRTEENLREFLEAFDGDIAFSKIEVSPEQKAGLKKELGITTYPAMLINNQYKLTGIFPSETVKEYFCEINPDDKCDETTLSKKLI